ncbi:MAG TPA: lytic transglycosylase domain-containing protein [Longimicrobiaceae bacterium]|nr:lytic transglycosylase domain-containing protein [Longimicrobiaceae bacterium]
MQNRTDQNTLRGTGVRGLLRSRGVKALLAAVAVAQVGITAERIAQKGAATADASRRPVAMAEPLHMAAPVVVAELKLEAARVAAVDESEIKAKSLAEKYKRKGYPVTDRLAESIVEAALENDIEPELAFGLVRAESGFRNSATSHVGAVGLTQLMPRTARWLEPGTTNRDLRDSETNLRIGFGYLRDLIDKYDGDERLALLAYNRGPGTVDRVLRRGGNPDNGYVEKVMAD